MAVALLAPVVAMATEPPVETASCHSGAYVLADGRELVLQPSDLPNLRWRMLDGTAGKLFPAGEGAYAGGEGWSAREPVTTRATFGPCAAGRVRFERDGRAVEGRRIALRTTPVSFGSGDATLYGELVMPLRGKPKAVVVLQYGSGDESAVANNYVQHLLPLKDIAVFVFDKRGTGRSTGQYTAHFGLMAGDMVAAVEAIRALPELKGVPLGLMGESQGGWVAPLTAVRTKVDFVVVSYGLAVSIVEEDRSEVEQSLVSRGYGPDVLAQGEALHDAATNVLDSGFTDGIDELEHLKAASAGAPWRNGLGGDYTGLLTSIPREKMGDIKPAFSIGFEPHYDPVPTLEKLKVPMLWVLAGKDTGAPSKATITILKRLQAQGSPIDLVVFPNADHGIIAVDDAGKRLGRTAPGYFEVLGDWIATRKLKAAYGDAAVSERR